MLRTRQGQSIIEYTMVVGIITVVLFYMGTGIKRGYQSMLKVTADQVGNQQNSDQDFNDIQTGYMQSSVSGTQEANNKQVTETGYIPANGNAVYISNIASNETSDTITDTITNGGFSPTPPGQ